MKKKIALLAIIALVMTTGISAKPVTTDVNKQVLNTFAIKFNGAKEVTWNKTEHYIKANFSKDGQLMSAYFDNDGDLIGVARNILTQQLPISVNSELKKLVGNNWITDLFEYTNGEETSYFATIENGDQKLFVKSVGSVQWSLYRKVKKS